MTNDVMCLHCAMEKSRRLPTRTQRSPTRIRMSSLEYASSASPPTLYLYSPTPSNAGRACATRAALLHSPKCEHPRLRTSMMNVPDLATHHGDQHALSHRLSGDMFFYLRHLGTSTHFDFFGHRSYFFSSTPVVSGGASVDFRPT